MSEPESEPSVLPEHPDERDFRIKELELHVDTLTRKNQRLQWAKDDYWKALQKHYTRQAQYRRVLEITVLRVYRAAITTYRFFRWYRCQDCFKRRFRTKLYKEHETHQKIYLCPTCLVSANQLPNLKFVKVAQ